MGVVCKLFYCCSLMEALNNITEHILLVISECQRTLESEDLPQLDRSLTSLRYCSLNVRSLVTRQLDDELIDEASFLDLRELHDCLELLCVEYEAKILRRLFLNPMQFGRPRKIINIALVCCYNY